MTPTDPAPAVRARNPDWTRDELILALDLYMTNPASPPGQTSAPTAALSSTLNKMAAVLGMSGDDRFRNANGVYLKMMNFRRWDPAFAGTKGMDRGNKLEEVVWADYAGDLGKLASVAAGIKAAVQASNPGDLAQAPALGIEEAEEGQVLTRLHVVRERSRKLVEARKAQELASKGKLACEACEFDFQARYGELGHGYIEAHHTKPVHSLKPGDKTRLADLALLCANCHRMVHARRQWLSVDELRGILQQH